jgi:hypothetical protein
VRLEGTLDAFSLPDIFQLLSFTKKTGTLHLRREGAAGAVHVRDGAITGARADVARHELSRRLLGTGLVDDEALASAAEALTADSSLSLAQLLVERAGPGRRPRTLGGRRPDRRRRLQPAALARRRVRLRHGRGRPGRPGRQRRRRRRGGRERAPGRRLGPAGRARPRRRTPSSTSAPRRRTTPAASRDEWALLSLVDGRRTVADLVALSGQGRVRRRVRPRRPREPRPADRWVSRPRTGCCAGTGCWPRSRERRCPTPSGRLRPSLRRLPVRRPGRRPALPTGTVPQQAAPPTPVAAGPVIPERPEPFLPPRRAEHAEPSARTGSRPAETAHGSVDGATARLPEVAGEPAPLGLLDRDPSINKSLLLRLIAGVRGL